jgi:cell division septation protein DedD
MGSGRVEKGFSVSSEHKVTPLMTLKGKWLWAVATLFVAGWMFVLGLMIGRGTAPIPVDAFELSDELARLKDALIQKEQAKVAVGQPLETEENKNIDLGFFEELKKGQTQIPKQLGQMPAQPPKTVAQAKAPAVAKKADGQSRPAVQRKEEHKAPSPKTPAKTVVTADSAKSKAAASAEPLAPSASMPAASVASAAPVKAAPVKADPVKADPADERTKNSRYTIQVAAVKDAPSADKMVTALRGKNFPAYQLRGEIPGKGVWYRVRVGAFRDRASAEAMRAKLGRQKIQGIVVATP